MFAATGVRYYLIVCLLFRWLLMQWQPLQRLLMLHPMHLNISRLTHKQSINYWQHWMNAQSKSVSKLQISNNLLQYSMIPAGKHVIVCSICLTYLKVHFYFHVGWNACNIVAAIYKTSKILSCVCSFLRLSCQNL